jgi:hypothetical protein
LPCHINACESGQSMRLTSLILGLTAITVWMNIIPKYLTKWK